MLTDRETKWLEAIERALKQAGKHIFILYFLSRFLAPVHYEPPTYKDDFWSHVQRHLYSIGM